MANLDETGTPPGAAASAPTSNSAGARPKPPTPEEIRIRALERENRRLKDQVYYLERTLSTVAPELMVSEEQLAEEIAHAVPAAQVLAELSHNKTRGDRDAA